jgi:hypothetical protein
MNQEMPVLRRMTFPGEYQEQISLQIVALNDNILVHGTEEILEENC